MPSHSIPTAPLAVVALMLLLTATPLASRVGATDTLEKEHSEHRCIHDQLESGVSLAALGFDVTAKIVSDPSVVSKSVSTGTLDTTYQPIRIATSTMDLTVSGHYCASGSGTVNDMQGNRVACSSADILTDARRNTLVNTLLPRAIEMHAERLNVLRYSGNIQVSGMLGSICGSFTVPASHSTTGVDADMVMYVAAAPAGTGTIAWATSCLYFSNDRPAVGVINFNPRYIDASRSSIRVAVHEMAHALGFSYGYWVRRSIALPTVTLRGKDALLFASPKVLAAAKAQYGCSSMAGMELEDQGGSGTMYSHWKRRDALEELMAGISGVGFYTALTLASFEDTGVYTANYDKAEPMNWGYNSGCGLINSKCVINGVSQYPDMFCVNADAESCTSDFMGYGTCGMGTYTRPLPTQFQYFSNPTTGGSQNLTDYCPVVTSYSNRGCTNTANGFRVDPFVFSATSRCLKSRSVSYSNVGNTPGLCVDVFCNATTKEVMVRAKGSNWVSCPSAGGDVSIAGGKFRSGYVTCPTYSQICVSDALNIMAVAEAAVPMVGVNIVMLFVFVSLSLALL